MTIECAEFCGAAVAFMRVAIYRQLDDVDD